MARKKKKDSLVELLTGILVLGSASTFVYTVTSSNLNSFFTKTTMELARSNNVKLVNRDVLIEILLKNVV